MMALFKPLVSSLLGVSRHQNLDSVIAANLNLMFSGLNVGFMSNYQLKYKIL